MTANENKMESAPQAAYKMLTIAYFALLAMIAAIFLDFTLYLLGAGKIVSIFKSILLSVGIALVVSFIFANPILNTDPKHKFKIFIWGALLILSALPIYVMGWVWLLIMAGHVEPKYDQVFYYVLNFYFYTLISFYLLLGWWLAILSGYAALFLRLKLIPYFQHAQTIERSLSIEKKTTMHRSSASSRKHT